MQLKDSYLTKIPLHGTSRETVLINIANFLSWYTAKSQDIEGFNCVYNLKYFGTIDEEAHVFFFAL